MTIFKDKRVRAIAILAIIVGVLMGLKVFLSRQIIPQVTETLPKNGQIEVALNQKITIVFDQEIPEKNWQIVSSPPFLFSLKENKNILEIQPSESFKEQTRYEIEIKNSNFPKFYYSFSFTTVVSSPSVKGGRGDPNFYQEIQKEMAAAYPLLKYLPQKTSTWSIVYTYPLRLKVTMVKDSAEIRKEVLDWISSRGVDPTTYTIEWKVE